LTEYGDWGGLLRALAQHDYSRYADVLRWPLLEALESYEQMLRDDARRQYDFDFLVWAIIAQGASKKPKPPKLPAILKG